MNKLFSTVLASTLILSSCSSDKGEESSAPIRNVLAQELTRTIATRNNKGVVAQPAQLKRVQLAGISKPIAQISIPTLGYKTLFTAVSQSGEYNVYLSKEERSVTVKNGILTATRGFGNDLMSVDISDRERKTYSYINPENHIARLPVVCEITSLGKDPVEIVEITYDTVKTEEICRSNVAAFKNRYWRDEAGKMWKTEQWIGPRIGHAVIEVLN